MVLHKPCSTLLSTPYCDVFIFISNYFFSAKYTWEEINPVVPILAALQFIFVVGVLCRTACGDPGIIPRASPAEVAALERLIGESYIWLDSHVSRVTP